MAVEKRGVDEARGAEGWALPAALVLLLIMLELVSLTLQSWHQRTEPKDARQEKAGITDRGNNILHSIGQRRAGRRGGCGSGSRERM
jgi:hypothetical protein